MVVISVNNVIEVCEYLGLSLPEQSMREVITDKNGSVAGFGNLVIKLGKEQAQNTKQQFVGSNPLEEALVRQWIEYSVCTANYCDSSSIAQRVFKDLNTYLSSHTYMVGNKCTLADVVLYHLLSDTVRNLSYQEKEQYLHLSRWFHNLQQDKRLRGNAPAVFFSRTPLY